MPKDKIFKSSYRIRKAYWTTFVVMMRYLGLYLKSKVLGRQYYERKVFDLHLKNAEHVKEIILHLQGLFIKVGQSLSILTNFLPEAFHEPLEALQNEIPARPFYQIEERIIKELGQAPEHVFKEFDKTPLASASIGQVHRATLKTGEQVVVKVQHANIESIAKVDLKIIRRIIGIVSYFFKIKGLDHAYTQVEKMIEEELDFEQEGQAMRTIAENLKTEPKLIIPKLYLEYSTHRVLTSEFCEGVKISNTKQLDAWKVDRSDLSNRLVHAYCKMVFEDGVYHADPHPGNIMVQQDGTIVFLDFGAIGHLKESTRSHFLALIDAAVKNDDDKIISALSSMGFLAEGKDAERTAEKVIEAFRYFLQNEVKFDGLNFQDIKVNPFETSIFNLVRDLGVRGITNSVQVPKEYVLLNRMISLLLGICNTLDSNMNPIDVLQPYMKNFILGEQGNVVDFVSELVKGHLSSAIALPGEMNKTLKKLQKGEVELQVAGFQERNRLIYILGQQFLYVILLIVFLVFGFFSFLYSEENLALMGFGVGAFFFLLLLRSIWKNRKLGRV